MILIFIGLIITLFIGSLYDIKYHKIHSFLFIPILILFTYIEIINNNYLYLLIGLIIYLIIQLTKPNFKILGTGDIKALFIIIFTFNLPIIFLDFFVIILLAFTLMYIIQKIMIKEKAINIPYIPIIFVSYLFINFIYVMM